MSMSIGPMPILTFPSMCVLKGTRFGHAWSRAHSHALWHQVARGERCSFSVRHIKRKSSGEEVRKLTAKVASEEDLNRASMGGLLHLACLSMPFWRHLRMDGSASTPCLGLRVWADDPIFQFGTLYPKSVQRFLLFMYLYKDIIILRYFKLCQLSMVLA